MVRYPSSVPLDWDLFRELYSQSASPIWQAESHPNVQALARKIGVTPNTVWRRLGEWKRLGFLRGYVYIPNPRLLGVGMEVSDVVLEDPALRQKFLDRLEFVDGVFIAEVELGTPVSIMTIADSPPSRTRRQAMLRTFPGVADVKPRFQVWLPTPARGLRLNDYRLIAALRGSPDSAFARLAEKLGISARTFWRRFRQLKAEQSMLTCRIEDFSRYPGTVVVVSADIDPSVDSRGVASRISAASPEMLELPSFSRPPYASHKRPNYMIEVRNPSQVEEIQAEISQISGVVSIANRFPGFERIYGNWFDDRIHQILNSPLPETHRASR